MDKSNIEKRYLSSRERWITGIFGVVFFAFSVYLIFYPPIRQTIKNSSDVVEITKANSDQSTVIVFLMTAGSILTFYAINGLRFYKISAGPLSGESESGQGSAPPLEPSPQARNQLKTVNITPVDLFNSLTDAEKKVLRTLWRYQKSTFKDDEQKRWTFKLFAGTPEHPAFLMSVSTLLLKGLISVNPENDQCALTNEGIILMAAIGDVANTGPYHPF